MSNAALLMSFKVSPREIERIVYRLDIIPAEEIEIADAQEVLVAAVQLMLKRYQSLTDYIIDMNLYVADAVNRRAQLICFPAFAGMLPASFLPQFETTLQKLRPSQKGTAPDAGSLGECLSYFSDCLHDAHFYTMSALAARHRVYIMAGSALYFNGDDLCHRAFLFNDTGDLAGYQDKISLSPMEQELRLEPANEVKGFDTPAGPAAILIGGDADYFEIARVAKAMGARLLLHPTAMRDEYTPLRSTMGLNMRVQENRLFCIQSVAVGDTGLGFAA